MAPKGSITVLAEAGLLQQWLKLVIYLLKKIEIYALF